MHLPTRKPPPSGALPLQNAVLCVNCECVTSGRLDECPVCGSRSLLNIDQMLGGTPLSAQPSSTADRNIVRFDLTITIELKHMNPNDMNAALEKITRLIGPRLGQGSAGFHVKVEPVADTRTADELQAA